MQASVDFSLFSTPTQALGSVTGLVEVPNSIARGDVVKILPQKAGEWFSGELKVISVPPQSSNDGIALLGLEDVVAPSPEEAISLAARFESEAGLFVDRYERNSSG